MNRKLSDFSAIFNGQDISENLFDDRAFARDLISRGRLEIAVFAERSLLLAFKRKQKKVDLFLNLFQTELGKYNLPIPATTLEGELPPQGMAFALAKAMQIRAIEYITFERKFGNEKCCLAALALSMPSDNLGAIVSITATMFSHKKSKASVSNRVRAKAPRPDKCPLKAYLSTLLENLDYDKEFTSGKQIMAACVGGKDADFEFNGIDVTIEFTEKHGVIEWVAKGESVGKKSSGRLTPEEFVKLVSVVRTGK